MLLNHQTQLTGGCLALTDEIFLPVCYHTIIISAKAYNKVGVSNISWIETPRNKSGMYNIVFYNEPQYII